MADRKKTRNIGGIEVEDGTAPALAFAAGVSVVQGLLAMTPLGMFAALAMGCSCAAAAGAAELALDDCEDNSDEYDNDAEECGSGLICWSGWAENDYDEEDGDDDDFCDS